MRRFWLVSLLMFAGCQHVAAEYVPLAARTYLARTPLADIALTTKDLEVPYDEIGVIIVRHYVGREYDLLNQRFRETAFQYGADAVIKIDYGTHTGFSLSLFLVGISNTASQAKGVAVRFKEWPRPKEGSASK